MADGVEESQGERAARDAAGLNAQNKPKSSGAPIRQTKRGG